MRDNWKTGLLSNLDKQKRVTVEASPLDALNQIMNLSAFGR